MGTVEDDSHRAVVSFSPGPLESFLGISIAQVSLYLVLPALTTRRVSAYDSPAQAFLHVVLLNLSTMRPPVLLQVCCGGQHAAILTSSGLIYTWGRGGFGRLGHGDDVMCASPRLVRDLAEVAPCRQVCCGFAYTAAVTVKGQVRHGSVRVFSP